LMCVCVCLCVYVCVYMAGGRWRARSIDYFVVWSLWIHLWGSTLSSSSRGYLPVWERLWFYYSIFWIIYVCARIADADADSNHPQMEKVVWSTSAEPMCTHTTHTCHSLPQFLANVKPHNNTILMSVCVRAHVRVCVCDVVSLLVTVVRGQRGAEQGSDCRSSSLRSPPQKNASPKRQRARESARGICICANVRPRKRARERPTQCVCFVSCVTKQRRETP